MESTFLSLSGQFSGTEERIYHECVERTKKRRRKRSEQYVLLLRNLVSDKIDVLSHWNSASLMTRNGMVVLLEPFCTEGYTSILDLTEQFQRRSIESSCWIVSLCRLWCRNPILFRLGDCEGIFDIFSHLYTW